jgi:hypothetical protein
MAEEISNLVPQRKKTGRIIHSPNFAHAHVQLQVRLSNDDSSMKISSQESYWMISSMYQARFPQSLSQAAFVTYPSQLELIKEELKITHHLQRIASIMQILGYG